MPYPETSPILDFTIIDSHNTGSLGIMDTSFYPENFTVQNPTYEVTPPSFTKATIIYPVNQIVFVNSNTVNITCVNDYSLLTDLPDGIWTIRQSVSPAITYNDQKTFIRTTLLEQKFGKAFLKTDLIECNQDIKLEQMKILDQIWFFIQAAISAANQCNNLLAMKLYKEANDMLNNFIKGKSKC